MKPWAKFLLQFLASLSATVAVVFLGLWAMLFLLCAPSRDTVEVRASPDGSRFVRVVEINGGATTSYAYETYAENLLGERAALTRITDDAPEIVWLSDGALRLRVAQRRDANPGARMPGLRVEIFDGAGRRIGP